MSGIPISGQVNQALIRSARAIFRKGGGSYLFKTSDAEGMMRSNLETCGIGAFFGIRFYAEVDSEAGSTKVDFIIRERFLAQDDEIDKSKIETIIVGPVRSGKRHPTETAAWN